MSQVVWCASCGLIDVVVKAIAFRASVVGLLSCLFGLIISKCPRDRMTLLTEIICVLSCYLWASSIFIDKNSLGLSVRRAQSTSTPLFRAS